MPRWSAVSSVRNRLVRYGGYYILCDLTEIPYLGQRANSGATGPRTW